MPPETSDEFQDMKIKINKMYEDMIGDDFNEGFIKKFNRYCGRLKKLEITVLCLIALLVGMGVLEWGQVIR